VELHVVGSARRSQSFAADSSGQSHVVGHDGDALRACSTSAHRRVGRILCVDARGNNVGLGLGDGGQHVHCFGAGRSGTRLFVRGFRLDPNGLDGGGGDNSGRCGVRFDLGLGVVGRGGGDDGRC